MTRFNGSTIVVRLAWIVVVGGNAAESLLYCPPQLSTFPAPWPIVFMPLVIVFGAFLSPGPIGETSIGPFLDKRLGQGTYAKFITELRPELLLAAMCFAIAVCGLVRRYAFQLPAAALVLDGFFATGGGAFLAAHFIRSRRLGAFAQQPPVTISTPSIREAQRFWANARQRQILYLALGPMWLLGGPLTIGVFSFLFPDVPFMARAMTALVLWVACCSGRSSA